MKVQDVRDRLDEIAESTDDPEAAHMQESGLWMAVLRSVADGTAEDVQAMAKLALESDDIVFPRWFA